MLSFLSSLAFKRFFVGQETPAVLLCEAVKILAKRSRREEKVVENGTKVTSLPSLFFSWLSVSHLHYLLNLYILSFLSMSFFQLSCLSHQKFPLTLRCIERHNVWHMSSCLTSHSCQSKWLSYFTRDLPVTGFLSSKHFCCSLLYFLPWTFSRCQIFWAGIQDRASCLVSFTLILNPISVWSLTHFIFLIFMSCSSPEISCCFSFFLITEGEPVWYNHFFSCLIFSSG